MTGCAGLQYSSGLTEKGNCTEFPIEKYYHENGGDLLKCRRGMNQQENETK